MRGSSGYLNSTQHHNLAPSSFFVNVNVNVLLALYVPSLLRTNDTDVELYLPEVPPNLLGSSSQKTGIIGLPPVCAHINVVGIPAIIVLGDWMEALGRTEKCA